MENGKALDAFGALSQITRLEVFRLLVRHEPHGLASGEVARTLEVPHNTMSTHLNILARAGLIVAQRQSRSIVYRADIECLRGLVVFLVKDCCNGEPSLCAPLIADLIPCCPPETVDRWTSSSITTPTAEPRATHSRSSATPGSNRTSSST